MFNYVTIFFGVLTLLYFYGTRTFKYWKNRGVKYEEPFLFFGNIASTVMGTQSTTQFTDKLYWKYPKEKVVGYFHYTYPTLLIRDPEIVKSICTKNFRYFYSRGYLDGQDNDKLETLMKHVFFVDGDLWRVLKTEISPTFTKTKLKAMFPIVVARAERLRERLTKTCAGAQSLSAFDIMRRYNIDFISAFALGLDVDTQKKEESAFRNLGHKIYQIDFSHVIVYLLKTMFPVTFKNLKYLRKVETQFCNLVKEIVKQRDGKPSKRHTFIDRLLKIKDKKMLECESLEKIKPDGTPERVSIEFDDTLFAAQVFMFFSAGFETSSTATSYTLHEIAYNPEKQMKIQAEIDDVLAKYNNKLCYEAIKEMHYLEWALKEGMRMFAPVGFLLRICQKKCLLPDVGLTVEEGVRVVIPVSALNYDSKYWNSPEEFHPERFSPEMNEPKHKAAYLPFGDGPRSCIGERLGLMQSIAGLAAILSHFSVSPAPTSVRRPPPDPMSNIGQKAIGGLPLIFTPRSF